MQPFLLIPVVSNPLTVSSKLGWIADRDRNATGVHSSLLVTKAIIDLLLQRSSNTMARIDLRGEGRRRVSVTACERVLLKIVGVTILPG